MSFNFFPFTEALYDLTVGLLYPISMRRDGFTLVVYDLNYSLIVEQPLSLVLASLSILSYTKYIHGSN